MSPSRRGRIPKLTFDHDCEVVASYFFDIRPMCGQMENVMTMSHIEQWQKHSGIVLLRWERDAVFAMDRAYRHGYHIALKFHHTRKQKPVKKQGT